MEARRMKTVTLEEFNTMEQREDMIYELMNGIVMMSPRPAFLHQTVLTNLLMEIGTFLKGKSCRAIVDSEIEIGENVLVPDLFVYCSKDKWTKQRHVGAPTIAVEILSPSSGYRDRTTKLRLYESFGVKEYWVISPHGQLVTIYHFENETMREYTLGEVVVSDVMIDFEMKVDVLFE